MYTIIPKKVADNVPSGIDFRGFLKSPDKPTPAVIPVKAGNIMAKTIKKSSLSDTLTNTLCVSDEMEVLPRKNKINDTARILTTPQRAVTPKFAPLRIITSKSITVAGILIIQVLGINPVVEFIQSNKGVKASENAII